MISRSGSTTSKNVGFSVKRKTTPHLVGEAVIIDMLTNRNNAQHSIHRSKRHIQEKGKPLDESLRKALPGHREEVALALKNSSPVGD